MSYVNFNRGKTKNQIEALSDATDGKIYFATDGGIYVGNANGTADKKADLNVSIPFAQVDNTSTSTAFTATVPGITQLKDGTCVMLYNGVATSESGFTLNVNGLGAHPVFNNMTAATRDTTIFNVAYTMLFVYDATRVVDSITGAWCCYRGYDNNTNTIGYQLRTNSTSLPMKSKTYRYRLLFTSADGAHFVPANNSSSTNATAARTACQDPIDPFGKIVYYGTTTAVNADSRPSTTVLWSQYNLSLGYSFNTTGAELTLISWKPVYVKCSPQTNGSAIIDSTTPYVQDLPTTEDGKIYIFLGIAYDETHIELYQEHPVYYYKDGAIRLWTNAAASGSSSNIFIAEYDSTDYNTCYSAWNAGKTIICHIDESPDHYYIPLTYFDDEQGGVFIFNFVDDTKQLITITLEEPGNWSSNNTLLQNALVSGTSIKTVNGSSLLGSGNLDVKDVFIAEYGVTTYADILTAYNSEKSVYCVKADSLNPDINYILPVTYVDSGSFIFSGTDGTTVYNYNVLYDNTWTNNSITPEDSSNKVTSLSSSSTNDEYPSAKCVYDLVGDIETLLAAI